MLHQTRKHHRSLLRLRNSTAMAARFVNYTPTALLSKSSGGLQRHCGREDTLTFCWGLGLVTLRHVDSTVEFYCPTTLVWTSLYTGMGYGSYLVWKELGGFTEDALVPLGLYGLQLALNWAWTPIFFGAHKIKLALIELVMLTGTVAATMVSWYPVSRTATLLMAPYLAWLCLATSLNYCIWRDNPETKKD
ncbi:hypothetical protein MHYP_G00331660 [Metynnis hypsauchen]